MTDRDLLADSYGNLRLAATLLLTNSITHETIVRARDLTQAALSHLQELENRFRQGLITQTQKPLNDNDQLTAPSPS